MGQTQQFQFFWCSGVLLVFFWCCATQTNTPEEEPEELVTLVVAVVAVVVFPPRESRREGFRLLLATASGSVEGAASRLRASATSVTGCQLRCSIFYEIGKPS